MDEKEAAQVAKKMHKLFDDLGIPRLTSEQQSTIDLVYGPELKEQRDKTVLRATKASGLKLPISFIAEQCFADGINAYKEHLCK